MVHGVVGWRLVGVHQAAESSWSRMITRQKVVKSFRPCGLPFTNARESPLSPICAKCSADSACAEKARVVCKEFSKIFPRGLDGLLVRCPLKEDS